jgi:hypothetical protein
MANDDDSVPRCVREAREVASRAREIADEAEAERAKRDEEFEELKAHVPEWRRTLHYQRVKPVVEMLELGMLAAYSAECLQEALDAFYELQDHIRRLGDATEQPDPQPEEGNPLDG